MFLGAKALLSLEPPPQGRGLPPGHRPLCRAEPSVGPPGPEARGRSSARVHLAGRDDTLVGITPLLRRIADWARFLAGGMAEDEVDQVCKHSSTGRPFWCEALIERLECCLDRSFLPQKPGSRPKETDQG